MANVAKSSSCVQPDKFEFTKENFIKAQEIIARYPEGRQQSAVMPLLALAQKQHDNWLPKAAIEYVASILGMAPMRVYEVASFYSMYNLQPVGKYHLQVCGTTPCWLRGAGDIIAACEAKLGIESGHTTADGLFTLTEVECLGACVNAPMMQVTSSEIDGYYEDLTPHIAQEIIDMLAANQIPEMGPQSQRHSSEPETGATSLLQRVKPVKPKFAAEITTMDDTGAPSIAVEEAQEIVKAKKKAAAKKTAAKKSSKKATAKTKTAAKAKKASAAAVKSKKSKSTSKAKTTGKKASKEGDS